MKCKFIGRYSKNENPYFEFEADLQRVPDKMEIIKINGEKFQVGEIRTIIEGSFAFCEIAIGKASQPLARFC